MRARSLKLWLRPGIQARVAIVGSRRRKCKGLVVALVQSLPMDATVVSGGCPDCADQWAEEEAKRLGLQTDIYRPNTKGLKQYHQIVQAYYARNRQVALHCDIMFAFVAKDRTGGTENAIKHAYDLNKEVYIR